MIEGADSGEGAAHGGFVAHVQARLLKTCQLGTGLNGGDAAAGDHHGGAGGQCSAGDAQADTGLAADHDDFLAGEGEGGSLACCSHEGILSVQK